MKTLTMNELREELAQNDADNLTIYARDLKEIFLYGIVGYNDYDASEILSIALEREIFKGIDLEDSDTSIQVAEVIDEKTGNRYKITQFCQELDYENIVDLQNISK